MSGLDHPASVNGERGGRLWPRRGAPAPPPVI